MTSWLPLVMELNECLFIGAEDPLDLMDGVMFSQNGFTSILN
jgi:hypothetical protein